MDRRNLIGLGIAAGAVAAAGVARGDTPTTTDLPGDPRETIALWRGVPPGGEGVKLKLNLFERSPAPLVYRDRAATDIAEPIITVFRGEKPDGSALLIAPGGGYQRVVVDKEGFDPAHVLAKAGVTVFVLRYRLPFEGWADRADVPLQDAQRAMRLIKSRASALGIDVARLGVLGFSAGGHVAASLATRFDAKVYAPRDADDGLSARPAFAVFLYPVVSMTPPLAHAGSRTKLLGDNSTSAQDAANSCERLVSAATPPSWLALAGDDKEVDPQNSFGLFSALRAAKVPGEMHVFEEGGHGFGIHLAEGKPASAWPKLFLRWGAKHGFFKNIKIQGAT